MDFERHSNHKTSLNIGKIAVPILVYGIYSNSPEDKQPGWEKGGYANMSDKHGRLILESISKKELQDGWEDRYYVGQVVKRIYVPGKGHSTTFHILSMKECIGSYLEFLDKKYFIPKP